MIINLQSMQLADVVTAIGGLGTAAFGLLEALKSSCKSINRIGLRHIHARMAHLMPDEPGGGPLNALPRKVALESIEANWVNGNELDKQKAIARSLIKLHMSPGNAAELAARTNVDAALLRAAVANTQAGAPLSPAESDLLARFELILTAMIDEAYQLSDQHYRNTTRALAAVIGVLLALAGGWTLEGALFWRPQEIVAALLIGLLATPLAPVAKDLATALSAAVNAMQVIRSKK